MEIHGSTHVHGPHALRGPHATRPPHESAPAAPSPTTSDQLDISPAAQEAIRAAEAGDVRHDVVARIRQEIRNGTYETPEKLDQALDRLLDELA